MAKGDGYRDLVSTLRQVGGAITAQEELGKILSIIAEKGAKRTHSQVVLVEVIEEDRKAKPQIQAWYGILQTEAEGLSKFSPFSKGLYSEKKEIFIKEYFLESEGAVPGFARSLSVRSVTAIPLICADQAIGALYFFRSKEVPFGQDQKNFACALAIQAAIAVQHSQLILDRQAGYVRTIKILADIMDRKDSYTYGHSSRVMQYALMIADRMGIKGKLRQDIGDGGYLHDLGKINVDISILQKPGKLTPQEWERMIIHPDVGAEIVAETGVLEELAPIIRHHHEMFSGGGYPDGLIRDQIPMGSRVVSVADAFEAMTSDRPYRKGIGHEAAVRELRRHSGTQFDPEIVQSFVEAI